MVFRIFAAPTVFVFTAIFSIALIFGAGSANARSKHIITLGSPVFHQDLKVLRKKRARNSRRYVRRNSVFSRGPLRVKKGTSLTQRATHFSLPRRCSFIWQRAGSTGYRKLICKRGAGTRFPAERPWAYREFRKTANWDQSRAWQQQIKVHKLYRGDLEKTDHGRIIQGNPYRYLDDPYRYQQSREFGQKIFYPRADW